MKHTLLAGLLCAGAAWSQLSAPATSGAYAPGIADIPDSAVVAVFDDGVKVTMAELRELVKALPDQNQTMAFSNPRSFVQWWAGMRKLAQMAETEKLDEKSPAKEQLLRSRIMILGQAKLNAQLNGIHLTLDEIKAYYDAHKEDFKKVQVKAIYVAFGDSTPEGKTPLSEEAAKQKTLALLAQIRGGADFVKLAKENSDDADSRAKGGDFGSLTPKDNVPDAIRAAVFALKEGAVSDPVRQPKGYYLFKAQTVAYIPMIDAQDQLYRELSEKTYLKWLDDVNKNVKVDFPSPGLPAGPVLPGVK